MMRDIKLKLTAAVAINGAVFRAGAEIDVPEKLARNLLHRGRAVLATADEAPAAEAPAEKAKAKRKGKADEAPAGE